MCTIFQCIFFGETKGPGVSTATVYFQKSCVYLPDKCAAPPAPEQPVCGASAVPRALYLLADGGEGLQVRAG